MKILGRPGDGIPRKCRDTLIERFEKNKFVYECPLCNSSYIRYIGRPCDVEECQKPAEWLFPRRGYFCDKHVK